MKILIIAIFIATFFLTGFTKKQDEIEFVCMKTHKASNTCHFNFKVNGANYRYVDVGCRYSKKQNELVEKVKEGTIFLARDWKISCPEPKN